MFQKNIDAIRLYNPKLADKLVQMPMESIQEIDVYQAESNDLIIAHNKIPLHSPVDPIREAKTLWNRTIKEAVRKNDIQLVFGLGLGYLFKRAFINAPSKVFVFEPNIEIIRFVVQHVDFSAEFSDKRIYITDEIEDIYAKLNKEFLAGDKIEFLFIPQYAQVNNEKLQALTAKIYEIIENRSNDENTIFKLSKLWTENFISNIAQFPGARTLGYLEGKFSDKTAIIVSPGPSLANDIELIKQNQDKFITIAVGKVFRQLIESGITPDFTVFADAKGCKEKVEGVENALEKTNAVVISKSDKYVYNTKTGSKIIYFSETDIMTKIFKRNEGKNPGFYKSGSSVSIIAYYFAKILGIKQIIFSGLDLAFVDNKLYSNGTAAEILDDNSIKGLNKKVVYVKDKEGNELASRDDYALFIRQFSEILAEEFSLAKVYNTSLKGAYIEGMEYVALSGIIADITEVKPDVNKIISKTFAETEKDWILVMSDVYSKLTSTAKEIEELTGQSSEIALEFSKIITEYKETGKVVYEQEKLASLNERVIKTRQKVVNNVFLATFLQKEIWFYTKEYSTKPLPEKEEIVKNLKLDRRFFNVAQTACNKLKADLDNTIKVLQEKQSASVK